jgi:hypothetical protein
VATARAADVKASRGLADSTVYNSSAAPSKTPTLLDASGSLEVVDDLTTDYDPGAGSVKFNELLLNGTLLLVEIQPGGAGGYFRCWALFDAADLKVPLDGVVTGSLPWQAVCRTAVTGGFKVAWAFGT